MEHRGKLELTWVGKYEESMIEPRILIEDPEKSYGDPRSENMLIHGDNLIALQALQQDFAGRIKCIYIDPPYNTGSAFEQYDDNVEHSIWLSLMRSRLKLLWNLLSPDGSIWISIDDNEEAYLRAVSYTHLDVYKRQVDMLYAADFMTTYGKTFGVSTSDLNGDNQYKFSEFVSRRQIVQNSLKKLCLLYTSRCV